MTGIVHASFCCPECGAGLRFSSQQAGTVIGCHCCGEAIRIPRQLHPIECDLPSDPLLSSEIAHDTEYGLRWLGLSLLINFNCWLCASGVVLAWIIVGGPAALFNRDYGTMRLLLISTALTITSLMLVTGLLRLRGYCKVWTMAQRLRGSNWLITAMVGVVVTMLGLLMAVVPYLLVDQIGETPSLLMAVVEFGRLAVLTGIVAELAIMFVWSKLLTELLDRDAARSIIRYSYTLAVGSLATMMTLSLSGMIVIMAVRRGTPDTPHPETPTQPDFSLVPDSVWCLTLIVLAIAFTTIIMLCGQYLKLLQTMRRALQTM